MIDDTRTKNTEKPNTWVVATDRFMSGWGGAKYGMSYVAYPCYSEADVQRITSYCKSHPNFIRVRHNLHLPRLTKHDHLSVYDQPNK